VSSTLHQEDEHEHPALLLHVQDCRHAHDWVRRADGAGPSTANGAAKKKVAGRVVFGGGNRLLEKKAAEEQQKAGVAPPPPAPKTEEKKEEPSFQAFSGKARSLKD